MGPDDRLPDRARPQRATSRALPEPRERRRLGDVLVESGLITSDQLTAALSHQRDVEGPRKRIGQVVVELGFASEREVAECLARLLNLELVDLSRRTLISEVVRKLPKQVAERTRVLVMDQTEDGVLVVAAADPTNVLALDDVRLYTRSNELEVYVATDSQIRDQLNKAWSLNADNAVDGLFEDVGESREEHEVDAATVNDDAPVVRFVNRMLVDAVKMRASDVHVEVERDQLKVRYRVDGQLRDITTAPKRLATPVISRIKIISGLDIAERRVPQDGRTRFAVENQAIDSRISTLPSLHGEKVVIRLLTRGDAVPELSGLGMEPEQFATFERALSVPQGLILITGPTGSGKTNTLYSAISHIQSPDQNIVTLEDPIEVQLPGITQVQVNEKTGMTFSRGLRSILRQDPDIILVGEVRDGETAELALKASMTGHLVLTTLHTNSATAALTRLVDMGAEPFLVASSLTASVAQRLVRVPCRSCLEPYRPEAVTLALLGLVPDDLAGATPRQGAGCQECAGTGYRGRTAVYEILTVDTEMRQVLIKSPTEDAISSQARASGMVTLRAAAILKAMRGETTFEEAARVTHSDSAGSHACPACQRPVASDMVACPWCATTLDRGQCQRCGRNLDPNWQVCPWCRTPAGRSGGTSQHPGTSTEPRAAQRQAPAPQVRQQEAPSQAHPPQGPHQGAPQRPPQGQPQGPPQGLPQGPPQGLPPGPAPHHPPAPPRYQPIPPVRPQQPAQPPQAVPPAQPGFPAQYPRQ